jgi:hypothetical protein
MNQQVSVKTALILYGIGLFICILGINNSLILQMFAGFLVGVSIILTIFGDK